MINPADFRRIVFASLTALLLVVLTAAVPTNAQDFCFTTPIYYNTGGAPRSVVTRDLNGDGRLDLASVNQTPHTVAVQLGNGDGTFQTVVKYGVIYDALAVAAVDVDGDGDIDLAVALQGAQALAILKNNGSGSFDAPAFFNGAGISQPVSICAAKLDGDNDYDLATVNNQSNNVTVWLNNGNGSGWATANYATGAEPQSVVAADLDGDGDVDLATANYYVNNVGILKNNGSAVFAAAAYYGVAEGPWDLCAADLDQDNDIDLAVACNYSAVSVLKNSGSGSFAGTNYTVGTSPVCITAADFDGDTHVDLAVGDELGPIWILKNTGGGVFASPQNIANIGTISSIASGTFDNDTKIDLVLTVGSAMGVAVLLNCPPSPRICFDPSSPSLSFTAIQGDPLPQSQSFTITNCGGGTLNWSITDNATWLDEDPLSRNSNNTVVTAWVNTTALPPNTYTATITVSSTNADNWPQTIPVTYTVQSPPRIYAVTISPNPPEIGSQATISWQSEGAVGPLVNIEAYNGISWVTLRLGVTNNAGANSWPWMIPNGTQQADADWAGTGSIVRVWSASVHSVSGETPPFNISGFKVTTPNGGESWNLGETHNIYWTTTGGSYGAVQIDLSTDGGATWVQQTGAFGTSPSAPFTWTIPVSIASSGNCMIKVRDYFRSEVNDISNISFTLDGALAFRPNPNGWQFDNSETNMWPDPWSSGMPSDEKRDCSKNGNSCGTSCRCFPSWQLFVGAFGENQTQYSDGRRIPTAEDRWKSLTDGLKGCWGGSCFGFAISSFLFFDGKLQLADSFPGRNSPYAVQLADQAYRARSMINKLWIYQFGMAQQLYINSKINADPPVTPVMTLQACQNMFSSGTRDDRILVLWNNDITVGGGHAINPYRCQVDAAHPETTRVYVYDNNYDNNYPGNDKLWVSINTVTNRWSYQRLPGWGGSKWLFLMDPVSDYLTRPSMPASIPPRERWISPTSIATSSYVEIYLPPSGNARLESQLGSIGLEHDSMFSSLTDGMPIIPITGKPTPPVGYLLPDAAWTITLTGTSDSLQRLALFTDSTVLVYSRSLESGAVRNELLRYAGDDRSLWVLNPDPAPRPYDIEAISATTDSEVVCRIERIGIGSGDSAFYSITSGSGLVVENHGPATVYDVSVEIASATRDTFFAHSGIPIGSNSAHKIVPDWRLYSDSLLILVDSALTGTFTDTLHAKNQNYCNCPSQGDISTDGVIDVFDVVGLIDIAFTGGTDPQDPLCPNTRGDVDNNGVTDVFDVIYLIATAFSGGPDPVNPCGP